MTTYTLTFAMLTATLRGLSEPASAQPRCIEHEPDDAGQRPPDRPREALQPPEHRPD